MNKQAEILRIKSRDQFNRLVDHVVTETHRALDHWILWRDLDAAFDEYSQEVNQSPQFWQLTRRAHMDSVILRLTRLFDPTKGSLSLPNLLQTIRHHVTAPAPTFLSPNVSEIDLVALDLELSSVSETDASVASLLDIRNQYLAHRQARLVGTGTLLPPLERLTIELLLERASQIATKYSQLCGRPLVLSTLPGIDDYRHLLNLLRAGLRR
jgi:AbiU2